MAKYYKPSGKFNPLAFLYFAVIALVILPLLGLLYAYAIWYIPFIYINFIIAAAFGFAIALAISHGVVKYGKVRNVPLTIGLSVLAGIIALYFHYAVWVDLVINAGESYGNSRLGVTVSNIKLVQTFNLALNPSVLFEYIGLINESGTWGIKNSTVSGLLLSIIWIVEAVIIIGIATFLPMGFAKAPFCELGNEWFKEKVLPAFKYIENRPELIKNLEAANPEAFKDLELTNNIDDSHSVFSLYSSNHNENYLSITNKFATVSKKDEIEFDDNDLIKYIYLNNELTLALNAK